MGPPPGPAAPVRLLRNGALLPHLHHGALPHRSLRRGPAEGRVRGRRRHHGGPQPRAHDRRRLGQPLRPRPRPGGGAGKVAEGKAQRLRHRGRGQAPARGGRIRHRRDGKGRPAVAGELADAMLEDYGMRKGCLQFVDRRPPTRAAKSGRSWGSPRGASTARVTEMMHRTHMGVDNDWLSILLHGLRNALSDGWGGSMIATEVSDILFGMPSPAVSHGQPGRPRSGPGQHRGPRPQPRGLRDHRTRPPGPEPCSSWRSRKAPRASTWSGSAAPATNC